MIFHIWFFQIQKSLTMSKIFKKIPVLLLLVFISSSCSESEEVAPALTEYGSWNITNLTIFFDDEGIEATNASLLDDFTVIKTITFNENGTTSLKRSLDGELLTGTYTYNRDTGLLDIVMDSDENYQYTMSLTEDRFTLRSINYDRYNTSENGSDYLEQYSTILLATVFALFDQEAAVDAALDKDPQFLSTESSFINVDAINY